MCLESQVHCYIKSSSRSVKFIPASKPVDWHRVEYYMLILKVCALEFEQYEVVGFFLLSSMFGSEFGPPRP
jgi:hypothetical protein